MAVTESYPEVADGEHLVLRVPFLIVEVTLRDVHVGTDAAQIIIHLLRCTALLFAARSILNDRAAHIACAGRHIKVDHIVEGAGGCL